jgi:UDP-N-acetylmuramoyl-tripeptide--D-alanyl-D-alanine ligase
VSVGTREALAASGARALAPERLPQTLRISTDTRTLQPGETFLALHGPNYDGERFVRAALDRGALALVVSDASVVPEGVPALVVADTNAAYRAFAGAARRSLRARVVAITGSTGKTTTKSLLAQLLDRVGLGRIAATPANENNEIGVSKLFVSLDDRTDIVVAEFGCRHYGDIEPLVEIAQPDIAILTNLGDAHLEIMGSRERLIETKFGIFASGALPILNAADPDSRARAGTLRREPRWFAALDEVEGELPPGHVTLVGSDRVIVRDADETIDRPLEVRLPGAHNLANLAAAFAAALALGAEPAALCSVVPSLALPSGRYERSRIADFEIIFDAYNASMAGTLATLGSFAEERASRRIAVLASMAELGDDARRMHERVGRAAASAGLALLLVGGEFADALACGARGAGFGDERIIRFADNAAAVRALRNWAEPGDLILFKGSRVYRLEEIVRALRDGG